MRNTGNTILITGGGSGIGAALAHRLHDRGDTVIVSGRRRQALQQAIAGRERMHAVAVDMNDPGSIGAMVAELLDRHPTLNVLVNNAGIMRFETLTRQRDLADAEDTITTNLLGPIRLTNALVEHLSTQPDAAIVNVTSGLAFVPLTATPTYCATKAAIHSYTESLRAELKGRVEVIELAPPGVQTDLTPGQGTRPGYMPLDAFADEIMTLWSAQPTPAELLVQNVRFLRDAEREGRFEQTLVTLNERAAKARAGQ